MTVFLAMGAAGLALFVLGMPIMRKPRLTHRIEPYVRGLHGRPSRLLAGPRRGSGGPVSAWIQSRNFMSASASDRRLVERLAAAGERLTPIGFRVEQATWGVVAVLGAWSAAAAGSIARVHVEARAILLLSVIAFVLGWLGRDWWLGKRTDQRRHEMQEELPTAIDLVTLAIMAGEPVPAALARAARVLGSGLGAELEAVVADIRAGSPSVEALYSLKRRLPGLRVERFVDAAVTAIERGAPLAEVLMTQADDAREERRRQLLEAGGRREILMLVPVVFLILPVVVVFALLPGLVSLDLLVP